MKRLDLFEPHVAYNALDDRNAYSLIKILKDGIGFSVFMNFVNKSPFSLTEWSDFLHLSERTMQRYKKEMRVFDAPQSERILEIAMLYKKGLEVFGDSNKFDSWLETNNLALGNIKPKQLLDNSFGINLIKDELTRIEYGILA